VKELLSGWEGRDAVPGDVESLRWAKQIGQVHGEAQGSLDECSVQVKLEAVGGAEQGLLPEARVEARSKFGLLTDHSDAVLEHLDRSTEIVPVNKYVDVRKYTPRWFRVNAVRECNAFEHAGFDARSSEAFERA
jgi:hypothetical protein